ncbi:transglycosylase domain-containing protein, partial [candidate division KSB1 bacterium]|nr:transglycosylase domain-containing protein [candidate division KSB1 bacterium]
MSEKKFRLIIALSISALVLLLVALFFTILTFPRLPDDLNRIALNNPSYIIGDNGDIVKILADREVVPLSQVSPHVVHAFLALEDSRFYRHHGIDKKGFLRALLNNLIHFRVKQGASTITQQVAKALFFGYERKWSRKIKEAFIALQIERQFPKDRILEAYINQIDFGSGVFGIELASQTYFGKHADELTLAESALIAGIPRWPARYNPATHADIAKERQTFVLKRMVEEGYISEEQKQEALKEEIIVTRMNPLQGSANYYVETVKARVSEVLGADAVNYGGLRIYTAMDVRLQYEATRAVAEGLTRLDELMGLPPYTEAGWEAKGHYPQAALVALEPYSGAVKALVGGRDFRRAPFNRALSNNRHAGSAFKPFIYFCVLDRGIADQKTVYVDEPVEFQIGKQSWAPDNIDFRHQGPVVLKYALMKSINTISAKLI